MEQFKKTFKICSNLAIKTPEWLQWFRFVTFIVNFKQIWYIFSGFSIADFD